MQWIWAVDQRRQRSVIQNLNIFFIQNSSLEGVDIANV